MRVYTAIRAKFQLGTRWNPRPLCPRERTPVPIEEEVGWVPEPVWTMTRRQNPLTPVGIRALVLPVRSLLTIPTELTGFVSAVSALHVKKSVCTLAKVSRVFVPVYQALLVWTGRHPHTVLERVGTVVLPC